MDVAGIRKSALLCVFGLLSACSQPEVFSEFHSFPYSEWDKKEAIRFEVPVYDISASYDVIIALRNNNAYPFRNIWLFIEYKTPGGSMRADTLCTDLADVYGKWYGKGISLYACSFPYQLNVQYPDTGIYTYTIRQGMRADVLEGVSDIGLQISKK
ncbi:MAG: gliding motility lipoprotein GldH [Dysgonamonadaceae bacterium]|jgi:gliding motility-associated lipoprotein GldH|nr:gliding motility lipoprotein GldH [Dysgonamonadaceae bacterium]